MTEPTEISREALAALPIRRYDGDVFLVTSPSELEEAMADLSRELGPERLLGLDTETRPAFAKGESHLPCLVQVATERTVFLFQLNRVDCSGALTALLEDASLLKVGVALKHDLRQLKLVFPFEEAGVIDVGLAAKRHGALQTGVRSLAAMFLGIRVPKGASTSNWAARRLTDAQVTYAATDAWACRELGLCFLRKGWLRSEPLRSAAQEGED